MSELAEAASEGRRAVAMCLECEWSSPELRNVEQAKVMSARHNWLRHRAPKP